MYICDNPSCKIWLHKECLVDDVASKTYDKLMGDDATEKTNGVARATNGKKSKAKRYKGIVSVTIKEEGDEKPKAIITDLRPGADPKTWEEPLNCPKCDTELS